MAGDQLAGLSTFEQVARFAALIESRDDALVVRNTEGLVLSWNGGAESLFGFNRDEAVGANLGLLLNEPEIAANPAVLDCRRKDGTAITVDVRSVPLSGSSGAIAGYGMIFRERVSGIDLPAAAHPAMIVEWSTDAIISRDRELNVVSWNAAAERLFGYTAAEAIGQDAEFLRSEAATTGLRNRMAPVLAGERMMFEDWRRAKDGSDLYVQTMAFPIYGPHAGEPIGVASISRDRTRIKWLEDERVRLEAIVASSSDAVIARDRDLRITTWNPAAEKVYGYSAEEALGRGPEIPTRAEDLEQTRIAMQRALAGEGNSAVVPRRRKDGSEVLVEQTVFPVYGEGSAKPIGIASIGRDVTEARAVEEAVALLAAIVESSNDAVVARDPEGRTIVWNAAAERLYGYTKAEALGMPVANLHTPEDQADSASRWDEIQRAGLRTGLEVRRQHRDGTILDVELDAFPVRGSDGTTVAYAGFSRDIAARKAAQAEVARLAAVVEHSTDAIITRGLDRRILTMNPAAERLFGVPSREAIGTTRDYDFIRPSSTESRESRYARLQAGEALIGVPFELVRPDGAQLSVEVDAFPVRDSDGVVTSIATVTRDITARKRSEDAVAFLAGIVSSSHDAILTTDRAGRVLTWNAGAVRLFGHSVEEAIGKTYRELNPPAVNTSLESVLQGVVEGRTGTAEFIWPRGDGNSLNIAASFFPIYNQAGEVSAAGAIARDITEREAARVVISRNLHEEQLLARLRDRLVQAESSNEIVEATMDALDDLFSPDRVAVRVTDFMFATATPYAGARRLSMEYQQAMGRVSYWDRGDQFSVPLVLEDIRTAPIPEDFRSAISNEGIGALVNVSLMSEGRLIGSVNIYFDQPRKFPPEIVQRMETVAAHVALAVDHFLLLRAVRDSEAQLRAIFEASADGIVLVDRDGTILAANSAADRLAILTDGEPVEIGGPAQRYAGDHSDWQERFDAALAGGTAIKQFSYASTDGTTLSVDTRFFHVPGKDASSDRVLMVVRDISEHRRAEQALLQAQKMESLGILAGGIAHDFNNLLVGILGNAGLAKLELQPDSPAWETVHDIETAGRRAADLARQMLAYSGKGQFVVQAVNLNEVVKEVTQLLHASIGKNVRLDFELAPHLPLVEADSTQIRQVAMNLVVNASDAIGADAGTITLSSGTMFASKDYLEASYLAPDLPAGEYVFLEVADTGCGMDSATLSRIFDPFFTTKFTGRGIGLAAVLGIVRGHGGALRVTSEPRRGSTFRLLLPLAPGQLPTPSTAGAHAAAEWVGSGRVLVVDDEASSRRVVSRTLSRVGFEVVEAVDGLDGVEKFENDPHGFACVLLDMTMPRMGGRDAQERISSIAPGIPVILMSGFSEQEAVDRFRDRQISAFLQKPFTLTALLETVRRVTLPPVA